MFSDIIEQMLEVEMEEHLGYEKNSVVGKSADTHVRNRAKIMAMYSKGMSQMDIEDTICEIYGAVNVDDAEFAVFSII